MVLIWPQKSCFSPVVAGNRDLPFKWPDPCLPQCSFQVGTLEGPPIIRGQASNLSLKDLDFNFALDFVEKREMFKIQMRVA